MNLPGFLIIGAQKCGTTTLFHDLSQHPDIFMPKCKEVGDLRFAEVLSDKGAARYAAYFRQASRTQLCGEAATSYAKYPYFEDSAKHARDVLGPELKIIYIVRDPIARIVSHHAHAAANRRIEPDINVALAKYDYFVQFSSYALQLKQWLAHFPSRNIRVVHFEDYVARRRDVVNQILAFLSVSAYELNDYNNVVLNKKEDRRVTGKALYKVTTSKLFKAYIRPGIPDVVRAPLKRILTRPAKVASSVLTRDVRETVASKLADDQIELAKMLGYEKMEWAEDGWPHGPVSTPDNSG